MRRLTFLGSLLLSFSLLACSGFGPSTPAEMTLFHGGVIYTGNPDHPIVDGVIVGSDGRILATDSSIPAEWGAGAVETINLNGAVMYPGLVDAHVHLQDIGERELTLNLEGTSSIENLVARSAAELQDLPAGELLYGRGWIETGWPEERMPNAADLDAVSTEHPIILVRADGHALVANTAAMKAVGITDATLDPDGGLIERSDTGVATGVFIDNAMEILGSLFTKPTDEDVAIALETGSSVYVARGWTGVHNMSVETREAAILEALDIEGLMPLRVYNAYGEEGFTIASGRLHETDTIQNRAVKIYMDGALGSRGALLIEPYSDRPESSGLSLMSDSELRNIMARASAEDVQLAIHAIGDLANQRILDAAETSNYKSERRWRIEHAQIFAPDDIQRVADLGLIASMQPSHAIGDLKFAGARLGLRRLRGAYAWQSLLKAGAIIAGGSDAPVEIGSPMIEFYAAVARKDLDGNSGRGWRPGEAVSRAQALAMFTTGPAYASFQEDDLGTIEVGKIADFTVLSDDIMTIPEAEILTVKPMMTVVGGEVVWKAK
jgi:predicted amidohydrolase YtcJ